MGGERGGEEEPRFTDMRSREVSWKRVDVL